MLFQEVSEIAAKQGNLPMASVNDNRNFAAAKLIRLRTTGASNFPELTNPT